MCKITKIRFFRALVLPVLLYGSKSWSFLVFNCGHLNYSNAWALYRIMGYYWDDFVYNDGVLREAEMSLHHVITPTASRFLGVRSNKLGDLFEDQSGLEQIKRKTACDLVAYNWQSLVGFGTNRKSSHALLWPRLSGLAPGRGCRDTLLLFAHSLIAKCSTLLNKTNLLNIFLFI